MGNSLSIFLYITSYALSTLLKYTKNSIFLIWILLSMSNFGFNLYDIYIYIYIYIYISNQPNPSLALQLKKKLSKKKICLNIRMAILL